MKKIFSFLFFILVSVSFNHIFPVNTDYGLRIKAFPVVDQEKTSFILENSQALKLNKEMTMSFDLFVRRDNVFGVVFRIITDKKDNIDLLFTVGENDKRYPMLVINESVYMITHEIVCDEWTPVSITLSSEKDEISISYGSIKQTHNYSISKSKNAFISFGLCPIEGYTLYDIASINIRDIKIFDKDKEIRNWKLDRHDGNRSFDSIDNVPAIATNPQWISDMYATWEKVFSRNIRENSLFAYNPDQNLIYIVSPDSKNIIVFNPEERRDTTIQSVNGIMAANAPNQLFYDVSKKVLVSYNLDENLVSDFNFNNQSWSGHTKSVLEHSYWNNSVSALDSVSGFISFGGYGFYKYNNELIRLSGEGKIIKKSTLPDISPRYSASTVVVNNTLYIFGGRGNKSGRQELSPRNTYDFYSVNLLTEQTNKLWEDDSVNQEFIPSENMIYDEKEKRFYLFTTKGGGMLMSATTEQGLVQMSYPIEEDLTSHYLYANLYFSEKNKKFYALVNKVNTDNSSELNIYSLNFPPIVIDTETNIQEAANLANSFPFWRVILIVAALALLGFIIYRSAKKRSSDKSENHGFDSKPEEVPETPVIPPVIENKIRKEDTDEGFDADINYYDFTNKSICFLGGFSVIDKNGQDVTGQYTPMLKYLLVLLILNTEKDNKGISGKKLIQLLWFDKNEDSAKNNRNVYLSKLRTVLDNIGGAEIINQNGFLSIRFDDEITCDYIEAMRLFDKIKNGKSSDRTDVAKLLELLLRGVLLPNTEADWVDYFKSDFSNLTIDVLTELLQQNQFKLSDDLKLKIADTLFLHDYVNEEALYLKCSILFKSGKKGLAKSVYDNFCKEYRNLLGIDYKYSITDVVNRKNIEE